MYVANAEDFFFFKLESCVNNAAEMVTIIH